VQPRIESSREQSLIFLGGAKKNPRCSDSVADIIGGGFNGFVGIKNAFRVNADKLKIAMKPLGY
jgi:hypothetical protein